MKILPSLLLLLPFLLQGTLQSALPIKEKRQLKELEQWMKDANAKSINASKKNATKIEELKPMLSIPGVKRKQFIHGPYTVYGQNSTQRKGSLFKWPPNLSAWSSLKPGESLSLDEEGTGYQNYVGDDFLADVTILKVETGILTKDLKRAETKDGIYNHHNLWFDLTKSSTPAFGCEGVKSSVVQVPMTIFGVGGAENIALGYSNPNETPSDLKTGYYLNKNRLLLNMVDVVNYAKEDQQVYQYIDMEYLEGKPEGRLDVVQITFDPFMCNQGKDGLRTGIDIRPKPGQTKWTINAGGITVQKNGYLVSMRGHLHDGGSNIVMKVNGKEVCNSKAVYGGPGHTATGPDGRVWETINEMTNCQYATKVNKGDKISVEASYDLEKHPSRLLPGSGGHGGHGGKSGMKVALDGGGEAEQMALFSVYFADELPSGK